MNFKHIFNFSNFKLKIQIQSILKIQNSNFNQIIFSIQFLKKKKSIAEGKKNISVVRVFTDGAKGLDFKTFNSESRIYQAKILYYFK